MPAVQFQQKAARLAEIGFAPAHAAVGERKPKSFLGAGNRHIEQAAFFFHFFACVDALRRRKKVLFATHHKNVGKLKPFGGVNGHERHLVGIGVVFLVVLVGKQGHILQKAVERDDAFDRHHFARFLIHHQRFVFAESLNGVEQFLHVVDAVLAFGCVLLLVFVTQSAGAPYQVRHFESVGLVKTCVQAQNHIHQAGQFGADARIDGVRHRIPEMLQGFGRRKGFQGRAHIDEQAAQRIVAFRQLGLVV